MDIADCVLCAIGGFLLLALFNCITGSWQLTVIAMFFWLCFKIELVYSNQKKITENQKNIINNQSILEKIIKRE